MKRLRYEIQLIIAIQKEKARTIGFIFVNDTNLVARKLYYSINNIDGIFEDIQWVIDTWEGYLAATRGVIRSKKLFVYLVAFKFKPLGEYLF